MEDVAEEVKSEAIEVSEAPDVANGAKLLKPKKLKMMLEQATQQMYRRNLELAEANKLLSLLRSIDSLALAAHDGIDQLCQSIGETLMAETDCTLIALMTNPEDTATHFDVAALATVVPVDNLPRLHMDKQHLPAIMGDSKKPSAIDVSNPKHRKQIAKATGLSDDQVNDLLTQTATQTAVYMRMMMRDRVVGVMVFGLPTAEVSDKQLELVDRLSQAVGVAIDNRLLFEENQRVVRQLRHTNDKLKQLNETKDDFIGMASHQLRTPLTSVKGYLSLVLDGDAGKVTQEQQKLLNQAFISSQRMVQLIADLLNVSRLRTGKFVIERSPTNIATMIGDEIDQLREMASARGIKLKFKPPADFPSLELDETKTRQVIMNFIDNAIYYTPTGGHIDIELKNLPKSVELEVVDDGIGVPKSEQPHLFTKFYRAKNAQRARPDGTGLGLFMAKKVIIAQGGAIVFKSIEGQGSTFGFSFPKTAELTNHAS